MFQTDNKKNSTRQRKMSSAYNHLSATELPSPDRIRAKYTNLLKGQTDNNDGVGWKEKEKRHKQDIQALVGTYFEKKTRN